MIDLAPVQLNNYEIKQALQHDAEFFIQFFLGDQIDLPVPEFHKEVFYDMTDGVIPQLALALPRGHAKTTLAKLAVVWHIMFADFQYILYMSNTHKMAVPSVGDIVGFLESQNSQAVFGKPNFLVRQEGLGVYKFELMGKIILLKAFGAGQQVRGLNEENLRPELIIVDDLEDNANISSEDLFIKLKRWVYGPFKKIVNPRKNKWLWLGNLIQHMQMLREHCESDAWHSKRLGCILADGTPLWPDLWPLEKLQADYQQYQKAGMADVWFAEMMNMPIIANGVLKSENITYAAPVMPEDAEFSFITVDLAISDRTWAHETVVAVHSWTGEYYQITQIDGWRGLDPIQLFEILVQTAFKWRVTCIGIENVAYQKSLQYVYPHLCREQGIVGLDFVELSASGKKPERILPWFGLLKSGSYRLTYGDIRVTSQALNYDPTKKHNDDDFIDCCAYGPQMTERYMEQIMRSRDVLIKQEANGSYAVCQF